MKRLFVLIVANILTFSLSAQNLLNTAFDTNGPVGELLFNQNDEGEIIYSGIVETPFPADTVLGLAREYLYTIEKKYKAKVSDRFEGITKVACDVELPVGTKFVSAPYAGTWAKAASTISFNLVIDIRPGKYRYTLSNFITDRWRIPGEGKDNGQSNLIHWQRVNSLNKDLNRARKKEAQELEGMIEKEKASYQSEYDAVMKFIDGLTSFAQINDDF